MSDQDAGSKQDEPPADDSRSTFLPTEIPLFSGDSRRWIAILMILLLLFGGSYGLFSMVF